LTNDQESLKVQVQGLSIADLHILDFSPPSSRRTSIFVKTSAYVKNYGATRRRDKTARQDGLVNIADFGII
jgi:hypothetical protein